MHCKMTMNYITILLDANECLASNGGCDQLCNNTVGSFECACAEGYILGSNGRSCSDIDECQTAGLCGHICVNTAGSYQCKCHSGFSLASDRSACLGKLTNKCKQSAFYILVLIFFPVDIDECLEANRRCEHSCTNSIGSFQCSCQSGYQLDSNNSTCSDIDECLSNPCQQTCSNVPGGFHCDCRSGYALNLDGFSCTGNIQHSTSTHMLSLTELYNHFSLFQ